MANIKAGTNEYLRFLIKDATDNIDLKNYRFWAEISKDKDTRETKPKYSIPEFIHFDFSQKWTLNIKGSTSLDDISKECYRCLETEPGFTAADGWSPDL